MYPESQVSFPADWVAANTTRGETRRRRDMSGHYACTEIIKVVGICLRHRSFVRASGVNLAEPHRFTWIAQLQDCGVITVPALGPFVMEQLLLRSSLASGAVMFAESRNTRGHI